MTLAVVAVQSCNRPWMLRLCLAHLVRQALRGVDVQIEVWDDSSAPEFTDGIRAAWYEHRTVVGSLHTSSPRPAATTKAEADARCGLQRQRIVQHFLERQDAAYLLLLDDDIVLGPDVLRLMLDDMRMLRSAGLPVGALAVHGGHTVHNEFIVGRTLFAHLNLTGEAAVLLSRECLVAVGNHFGDQPQGYADTQWAAMRRKHWRYCTRLNPPYQAQHIGLGDGSVIQHGRRDMFWLKDAWRANIPGKPYLDVPGFDVPGFVAAVKRDGCKRACEGMLQAHTKEGEMRSRGNGQRMSLSAGQRDYLPLPIGTLRLRVRAAKNPDFIVREEVWRNVILDNALFQFVHVLAGDDQANRKITSIQFGSGTNAADPSDTGPQIPLTPIKDVETPEYPDARSVKFTAFLDETELNGFPITEACLRFANGTFATRRVFSAQNKSEDFIFEFNWTLSFPAS